jgi:Chromo (CHRromatin Organisation MOdifier) domain
VAVQLELPAQWSIHPVFHTSLITLYTETPSHGPNFTQPPPDLIDGEEDHEVEQIRAHQKWGHCKTLQYLIKWKGYPESNNTWENANQIHIPALIKSYHRTNSLDSIKAQWTQLDSQHPSLLHSTTSSHLNTLSATIIRPSTAKLVGSDIHENTIRLACNPHLLTHPAQCPQDPLARITQLKSSVILTELDSTLQTSTANNDNLLYAPPLLAVDLLPKCLPMPPTTHQTSCQVRHPSNYLPNSP